MSFILDALKKSENERKHGDLPDIATLVNSVAPSTQSFAFSWKMFIGLVVFVNIASLLWNLGTVSHPVSQAPVPIPTDTTDLTAISTPIVAGTPTAAPIPAPGTLPVASLPIDRTSAAIFAGTPPATPIPAPGTLPVAPLPIERTPAAILPLPTTSLPVTKTHPTRRVNQTDAPPIKTLETPVIPPIKTLERPVTKRIQARVIGIKDGCQVTLKYFKNAHTIQDALLADVACLHPKSYAGQMARQFLTRHVFAHDIEMTILNELDSGTLVIDLFSPDGSLLNRALIASGLANGTGHRFDAEEQTAKKNKTGMWVDLPLWLGSTASIDPLNNMHTETKQ